MKNRESHKNWNPIPTDDEIMDEQLTEHEMSMICKNGHKWGEEFTSGKSGMVRLVTSVCSSCKLSRTYYTFIDKPVTIEDEVEFAIEV